MNKDKLEVGDLVVYGVDFIDPYPKGVGLVVAPAATCMSCRRWRIYWFKHGSIYVSNEHYLTKLSPTQEETK